MPESKKKAPNLREQTTVCYNNLWSPPAPAQQYWFWLLQTPHQDHSTSNLVSSEPYSQKKRINFLRGKVRTQEWQSPAAGWPGEVGLSRQAHHGQCRKRTVADGSALCQWKLWPVQIWLRSEVSTNRLASTGPPHSTRATRLKRDRHGQKETLMRSDKRASTSRGGPVGWANISYHQPALGQRFMAHASLCFSHASGSAFA